MLTRSFNAVNCSHFVVFCLLLASSAQAEELPRNIERELPAANIGSVEMTETKPAYTVSVTASHSRVFRTKQKIVRAFVSDPAVAELVVVNAHELVILGKSNGTVTINVWTENESPKLHKGS